MKNRKKELDVDYIGVQGQALTKEEELTISAFIKANKTKRTLQVKQKPTKVMR